MSRSEIQAWNTGSELAHAETDSAAPAELVAYLTGCARAQLGRGITAFLVLSSADLESMLSPEAFAARDRLTHDTWAYWVREGYEKTRSDRAR